jgi:hypothetical protein
MDTEKLQRLFLLRASVLKNFGRKTRNHRTSMKTLIELPKNPALRSTSEPASEF